MLIMFGWATGVLAQSKPVVREDAVAAPRFLAIKQIQAEFIRAGAGTAASNGILAAIRGDTMTVRRTRDRLSIDDNARVAMVALEVLTDPDQDIIEPYTRLKYSFTVDAQSHALMPIPDGRPTTRLMDKLKLEIQFQPGAAALTGQAIHYGLVIQLLATAAATNRSVVLADDVLFSRGNDPNFSARTYHPFSSERGPWTLLSFNPVVSEKYQRLPYSVFLQTLINNTKSSPLFYSGIWQDLLPYAETLSPGSQTNWIPVYVAVAEAFEAKRRYASGAFIRIAAAGQKPDDSYAVLLGELKSVPANDKAANRNIAIAYGYLVEAQVHFGKNISVDRSDHREIATILASRLDESEMKSLLAARTAPRIVNQQAK